MPTSRPVPVVLTLAGSDPTGGAGLQADLLTLAALGCHPLSVVTAITVQDTAGVSAVLPVEARWVGDQARTVLEDVRVTAIKVGMAGSADNVLAIARLAAAYPSIPLVVDPVLASGRGDPLADAATLDALREHLVPRATVVTPNSVEARRLAFRDADRAGRSLDAAAARLVALGARSVLVTGTHEATPDVVNTLYGAEGVLRCDRWPRLPGSFHGSGCTLASAIAAFLAQGRDVPDAVYAAQDYTWQALTHAFRPGGGQSIPGRFFAQQVTPKR